MTPYYVDGHEPHRGNHVGYACGFSGPHCWGCNEPWPCRASRREDADLPEWDTPATPVDPAWTSHRTGPEVTADVLAGAALASALMAANYPGDSGEDVDRLIAELAKRGYRLQHDRDDAAILLAVAEAHRDAAQEKGEAGS